jgi:hypothetical protein
VDPEPTDAEKLRVAAEVQKVIDKMKKQEQSAEEGKN